MDIAFSELGKAAEQIKTVHSAIRWISQKRKSSRTGQSHILSGIIGDICFAGDLRPFLPYLALGEYIQVGKGAAFGNGRYEMVDITTVSGQP